MSKLLKLPKPNTHLRRFNGLPQYKACKVLCTLSQEQWNKFKLSKQNAKYLDRALGRQATNQNDIPHSEKKYIWTISFVILAGDIAKISRVFNAINVLPVFEPYSLTKHLAMQMLEQSAVHPLGVSKSQVGLIKSYTYQAISKPQLRSIKKVILNYLLDNNFIYVIKGKLLLNKKKSPQTWAKTRIVRLNNELLLELKARIPRLEEILKEMESHWGGEDMLYRFYHGSLKMYYGQNFTEKAASELKSIAKKLGVELNETYLKITEEGTGIKFNYNYNKNWLQHSRPVMEAFFHSKEILIQALAYAKKLETAPNLLPSGWGTVLYIFNLR